MPVSQGDRRGAYRRREIARPGLLGTTQEFGAEIEVDLTLSGPLAEALVHHALRLKREPVALLADIVEHVLGDNLVDAVLDE